LLTRPIVRSGDEEPHPGDRGDDEDSHVTPSTLDGTAISFAEGTATCLSGNDPQGRVPRRHARSSTGSPYPTRQQSTPSPRERPRPRSPLLRRWSLHGTTRTPTRSRPGCWRSGHVDAGAAGSPEPGLTLANLGLAEQIAARPPPRPNRSGVTSEPEEGWGLGRRRFPTSCVQRGAVPRSPSRRTRSDASGLAGIALPPSPQLVFSGTAAGYFPPGTLVRCCRNGVA